MRRAFPLAIVLATLGACSAPSALQVKSFMLRDQTLDPNADPWTRMEKGSRLRGAISMEERRQRLGQYYDVLWNDSDISSGEAKVVFEYQQGGSASKIKRMTRVFPAAETQGRASFAVVGDDHVRNGRVLAWRATLFRGAKQVACRQSYLWQ